MQTSKGAIVAKSASMLSWWYSSTSNTSWRSSLILRDHGDKSPWSFWRKLMVHKKTLGLSKACPEASCMAPYTVSSKYSWRSAIMYWTERRRFRIGSPPRREPLRDGVVNRLQHVELDLACVLGDG